jgi:Ser/Thr protein kinase RdoA (MazF antagonist)
MVYVWAELDHDAIFGGVESALGEGLSNILIRRNSYINRVYELEEEKSRRRFIAKFYRPGRWTKEMVREEHDFLFALRDKDVNVIPPMEIKGGTVFSTKNINFALFPKMGGRTLDEFDKEAWESIGRQIARMHLVGAARKSSSRIVWKPSVATKHHLEALLASDYLPAEFKPSFRNAAEIFVKKAEQRFEKQEFILIHGDMHKGNLIHRPGEGTFIIDFDDSCIGPNVQDVWMLLPGPPDQCESEIDWFIKGYETFKPFDLKSLDLVPALRGMRLIHFAFWQSMQFGEPDFAKHFPEAGTKRHWNETIKEIQNIVYEELG